jgi:hypothetical protein
MREAILKKPIKAKRQIRLLQNFNLFFVEFIYKFQDILKINQI